MSDHREEFDRVFAEITKHRYSLDGFAAVMDAHSDRFQRIEELQKKESKQMDDTVGCLTDHAKRVDGILRDMKKLSAAIDRLHERDARNEIEMARLSASVDRLPKSLGLFKRISAAWRAFKDPQC